MTKVKLLGMVLAVALAALVCHPAVAAADEPHQSYIVVVGVNKTGDPQMRSGTPPIAAIRTNSKARVVNEAKVEANTVQPRAPRPTAAPTICCSAMNISK